MESWALQEHVLFVRSFKGHKQRPAESKKHDQKHHTEATHVPVNNLCKCLGVQTSGPGRTVINNHSLFTLTILKESKECYAILLFKVRESSNF